MISLAGGKKLSFSERRYLEETFISYFSISRKVVFYKKFVFDFLYSFLERMYFEETLP